MDKTQRIHEDFEISKELFPSLPPCFKKTRLGHLHDAINQYRGPFGTHVREYPNRYVFHLDVADPRSTILDHALYDILSEAKIKRYSKLLASVYTTAHARHLQSKTKERVQRRRVLSSRIGKSILKVYLYVHNHMKGTTIALGMLFTAVLCLVMIHRAGNIETWNMFNIGEFFASLTIIWTLFVLGFYKFKNPCVFYDINNNECVMYHLLKLEQGKAKETNYN